MSSSKHNQEELNRLLAFPDTPLAEIIGYLKQNDVFILAFFRRSFHEQSVLYFRSVRKIISGQRIVADKFLSLTIGNYDIRKKKIRELSLIIYIMFNLREFRFVRKYTNEDLDPKLLPTILHSLGKRKYRLQCFGFLSYMVTMPYYYSLVDIYCLSRLGPKLPYFSCFDSALFKKEEILQAASMFISKVEGTIRKNQWSFQFPKLVSSMLADHLPLHSFIEKIFARYEANPLHRDREFWRKQLQITKATHELRQRI